jgi:hypothetical protein
LSPLLALLAGLLVPLAVGADVGLIWSAQGGDIAPGEPSTQVQMVSEAVTLTLQTQDLEGEAPRGDQPLVARVEARFLMHNHGESAESHGVWFPLTTGVGYRDPRSTDYPAQAENFQAWIDGELVSVTEAPGRDLLGFRGEVPWATWPVTFPAGEALQLRVAYDVYPVDWGGWAITHYILETGADWHGPIGEGTVTFRLPYEVTPMNVQLAEIREAYTGPDRPFEISVTGTDLTWHFTELEPQPFPEGRERATHPFPETDNLILPLMLPSRWSAIEAARAAVESQPNSVEAHLRLAAALEAGTQRVKVFLATEANALLLKETDAVYRHALELAPQDVDVRLAYLKWLLIPRYDDRGELDLGEGLDALLLEAQELAPEDPRVAQVETSIEEWRAYVADRNLGGATLPPEPLPTSTSVPALIPTATSTPSPTRTPDPAPTSTPTPLPSTTATPEPANGIVTGAGILGVVVLVGLLVGLWLTRR